MPPKKKKPNKNVKDVYEVHHESFEGKPALIVCHRQPGQCPLLGLCNLLLLRHGSTAILDAVKRSDGTRYVSPKKLQGFVLNHFTGAFAERVKEGSMSGQERDQLLMEYQAQLEVLRSKIELYEQYRSIHDFGSAIEVSQDLFLVLGITRRHALVPDPVKDACLYNSIKDEYSFTLAVECMNYEAGCKKGEDYEQSYHDRMSLIKDFVLDGPPFTKYGLDRLREEALEKELFLLLLNLDLHVVYKRDGQLYLLATKEDVRDKYPDIMWFGLDENFDAENPAETKRKLTNTFTPINERADDFLQELEEEKRKETSVSDVGKETAVSEVGKETAVSEVGKETAVSEVTAGKETAVSEVVAFTEVVVDDSAEVDTDDSHKFVEMKRPKIEVDLRFLRFIRRCVVSLKEFTSYYMMSKVYHFKSQKFLSTSHLGRLMGKGYLVFICDVHMSGFSWNGKFKEEDMMIELELVDGSIIGAINCFITLTANEDFRKKHGVADLENFVEILFPRYLCDGFKELPFYFRRFEYDIQDMPDCGDPPEKLKKFHKYMKDHFFTKAPLARSTLVSDVYGLCDSEIVHVDQSLPKPRYGPLYVEITNSLRHMSLGQLYFSEPLKNVYLGSRVETHITESSMWTCWDLIELGRYSKQHLMGKTQENGVQQMDDPVLIDLIMEQDLKGLLTQAIKLLMQKNNFEGRFQSTWQHFSGSEDENVEVAELDAAGMQAAATVARAESLAIEKPERFIMNDFGMKLTEEGLRSLDGRNWILDEVIGFVYCQLHQEFMNVDDFFLVLPIVAHAFANLPEGSHPSEMFNPGNNNMFLFPVNNSEDHERGDGGTHWSLVALRVDRSHNECIFVHHDSFRNMNRAAADRLVGNLEKLFPTFRSIYKQGQTPQQVNGYDCGMYVICISHKIASWYKRVKDEEKAAEDWIAEVSKVTSQLVSKRRTQVSANLKKKFRLCYPGYFEEESSNQGGAVE